MGRLRLGNTNWRTETDPMFTRADDLWLGVKKANQTGKWLVLPAIGLAPRELIFEGTRALFQLGGHPKLTNPMQTTNTEECYHGEHTARC